MPKHYSDSGTCDSVAYATHKKGKEYKSEHSLYAKSESKMSYKPKYGILDSKY